HRIEQAGADALELNIYYLPTDPDITGVELEEDYVQLVRDVRAKVKLPIAVKLSPYFTALPNLLKIGRASCRERMIDYETQGRRRHTRCYRDWSSDVCSSDLIGSSRRVQMR